MFGRKALAHASLFLPMHISGGLVKHCQRTDLKRTGPFGCGRTGKPEKEKVKLNGQCEKRTTGGTVEWTGQRTEDCAATGNPMPRGGERGRRRASQKQPTDRAASQRLRGGRLPLRPIQTSLIKLSYVRADKSVTLGLRCVRSEGPRTRKSFSSDAYIRWSGEALPADGSKTNRSFWLRSDQVYSSRMLDPTGEPHQKTIKQRPESGQLQRSRRNEAGKRFVGRKKSHAGNDCQK